MKLSCIVNETGNVVLLEAPDSETVETLKALLQIEVLITITNIYRVDWD
jgi:hypothetical protein